jgi:2-hydroxychromene-2-carboxylate isomerase
VNIGDAAETVRIAAGLDINPIALSEALASPEIKERLKAEVDQSISNKVIGSRYIIADGEPFWGFDRFDQLEAFLKNGTI